MSTRETAARRAVAEAVATAREQMRTHAARPGQVQCYHVRRRSGGRDWSLDLTWTPGHLSMVGDAGEVSLTHHSALAEFEPGLRWAERGSLSYLLEKSSLFFERALDHEATAEHLVGSALEEVRWALEGHRDERRARRRAERAAHASWALEMSWWDATRLGDPPRLIDYVEPRCDDPLLYEEYRDLAEADHPDHAPAGWGLLVRLWGATRPCDRGELRYSRGRRAVAAALAEAVSPDGYYARPDQVAELCSGELRMSDYYGSYAPDPDATRRLETIRLAAGLVLDVLDPGRTWGRQWEDPIV